MPQVPPVLNLHINYKSGRSVTLRVTDWKLTTNRMTGEITEFSWTLHGSSKVKPIHLNLDEIESIYKDQ